VKIKRNFCAKERMLLTASFHLMIDVEVIKHVFNIPEREWKKKKKRQQKKPETACTNCSLFPHFSRSPLPHTLFDIVQKRAIIK
jgi:hypothetical protein